MLTGGNTVLPGMQSKFMQVLKMSLLHGLVMFIPVGGAGSARSHLSQACSSGKIYIFYIFMYIFCSFIFAATCFSVRLARLTGKQAAKHV